MFTNNAGWAFPVSRSTKTKVEEGGTGIYQATGSILTANNAHSHYLYIRRRTSSYTIDLLLWHYFQRRPVVLLAN